MNPILSHFENGVLTLTLNRVEKKNSLTSAMYAELAQALDSAQADTQTKVVLMQGHETVFSAGNDIADFLKQPASGEDSPVFRFLRGLALFPKPLIASVCGPAVGIGTTMLLHCDLVYAGDNAAFSMPFVNWVCVLRLAPACWRCNSWATNEPPRRCSWVSRFWPRRL